MALREHIPGIGFNFQVLAEAAPPHQIQDAAGVLLGGAKRAVRLGKDRHVEVHAPLFCGRIKDARQSVRQVKIGRERTVLPALHHLVQIRRLGEARKLLLEPAASFLVGRKQDSKRGADLDAPDFDAARSEVLQHSFGIFILHCKMAGVEANAHVLANQFGGGARGHAKFVVQNGRAHRQQPVAKEGDHVGARLQQSPGLWLDVEVDVSSGFLLHASHDGGNAGHVGSHLRPGFAIAGLHPLRIRQRDRGNAALGSRRQQSGQDVQQAKRVGDALVAAPIGGEYVLLDAAVVKLSIGEAVDQRDVEPILVKKISKGSQVIAMQQLFTFRG